MEVKQIHIDGCAVLDGGTVCFELSSIVDLVVVVSASNIDLPIRRSTYGDQRVHARMFCRAAATRCSNADCTEAVNAMMMHTVPGDGFNFC